MPAQQKDEPAQQQPATTPALEPTAGGGGDGDGDDTESFSSILEGVVVCDRACACVGVRAYVPVSVCTVVRGCGLWVCVSVCLRARVWT